MAEKRLHEIGVCCAEDVRDKSDPFNDVAVRARDAFATKSMIAATPPPERDIRISLRVNRGLEYMMSSPLDRCFGMAFGLEALTREGAIRADVFNTLDGLLGRLVAQNRRLKHYGVKVSVYAPVPPAACMELYSFLVTWCRSAEVGHSVPVSFDIARDETQFGHILETEHLRMVHGDTKAQFEALEAW